VKRTSLLFVALSLISLNASAVTQVPLIWCNGCTASAKQTAAMNLHMPGTVYVGDTTAQRVDAFNVWSDINDSVTPYVREWNADTTSTAEPYLSTAQRMIAFYNAAPKGWKKNLTITTAGTVSGTGVNESYISYSDRSKNVYNVIDPGVDQNNLKLWIGNTLTAFFQGAVEGALQIAEAFHVVDANAITKVVVTVKFDDGSQIDVDVDYSTTTISYKIDSTTGIDSHHNNVPPTLAAATCSIGGDHGICTYDFDGPGNPSGKQNWQSRMTLLGVTVQSAPTSGGHWACVKTGDGPSAVYSCQWVP